MAHSKIEYPSAVAYVAVFERDQDGFVVHFPDLKGCMSEGSNLEIATENTKDALIQYLSSLADDRTPFPRAGYRLREGGDVQEIRIETDLSSLIEKSLMLERGYSENDLKRELLSEYVNK